ncbi:hypothetical protein LX32DRAFT_112217 [Colletotrichum zoysiae]|uniref:Secreted protein n=1 Tax=Colletotrichum zoysiae TaxID=1216348 RepID=A0AAD9H882_9PEZI|nr:hypothetical protein LX32DRAFT_112217 [Colletotrichum zoysiae]
MTGCPFSMMVVTLWLPHRSLAYASESAKRVSSIFQKRSCTWLQMSCLRCFRRDIRIDSDDNHSACVPWQAGPDMGDSQARHCWNTALGTTSCPQTRAQLHPFNPKPQGLTSCVRVNAYSGQARPAVPRRC